MYHSGPGGTAGPWAHSTARDPPRDAGFTTIPHMLEALSDLLRRMPPIFDSTVGHLVIALGVLVAAFGFALLVVILLRRVLFRLGLKERIASRVAGGVRLALGPERASQQDVEAIAGRIVFWGLLILVVAGVASVVDLSAVGGIGGTLLGRIMGMAAQLGRALVLLLAAWFLAAVLRRAVRVALEAAGVDERLDRGTERPPGRISHAVPEIVYWVVLLLFLPPILAALDLEGVLLPIETVVNQVITFLPNVLGAIIIFLVGWFIARIAKAVVTNLLAAVGLDRAAERLGLRRILGSRTPSVLLGGITYLLVLFPVILTGLDRLSLDVITRPASDMLGRVFSALPLLLVAVALLLTAYVVGRVIANLTRDLLRQAGFDHVLTRIGLTSTATADDHTASNVVRVVVLALIMLFASIEAASLVGFDNAAGLLTRLLQFTGQFLLGVVFLGFGVFLANLSARAISASRVPQARLLALAARVGILLFTTAVGLRQMGIANEIIELAFGIVLGAVAVAFAVAFGLGGRDAAARQIERWQSRISDGER